MTAQEYGRNKLSSSCLRSIYYAFVHPLLIHIVFEIYANTCSTYLKPLNVLVNKLLRTLQNCRLQTPVAQYWEYQTLPVNQLFILQILTLVQTRASRNPRQQQQQQLQQPQPQQQQMYGNSNDNFADERQHSVLSVTASEFKSGQSNIHSVLETNCV